MAKYEGNLWNGMGNSDQLYMETDMMIAGLGGKTYQMFCVPEREKKEMVEEEVGGSRKGTRKSTTRLQRRKATFSHKSEREKKQIRKYSGDRLLDRHKGWVDWDATIQERKRENIEKMSLRSWREETDWWENHRWEDEEPTVNEDLRKRWEDAFEMHMGLCRMYSDRAKEYGTEFYATAAEEHRQHALDVLQELQYIK